MLGFPWGGGGLRARVLGDAGLDEGVHRVLRVASPPVHLRRGRDTGGPGSKDQGAGPSPSRQPRPGRPFPGQTRNGRPPDRKRLDGCWGNARPRRLHRPRGRRRTHGARGRGGPRRHTLASSSMALTFSIVAATSSGCGRFCVSASRSTCSAGGGGGGGRGGPRGRRLLEFWMTTPLPHQAPPPCGPYNPPPPGGALRRGPNQLEGCQAP